MSTRYFPEPGTKAWKKAVDKMISEGKTKITLSKTIEEPIPNTMIWELLNASQKRHQRRIRDRYYTRKQAQQLQAAKNHLLIKVPMMDE